MSPGAYLDAVLACLGAGLTNAEKVDWLTRKRRVLPGAYASRLDELLAGRGVYVLAEAARGVGGMVAT